MTSWAVLAWCGASLLVFGELLALANLRNVLRALVISSIAEFGYVLLGWGLGTTAGATGAVMHLGYQGVMRGLMFLALVPLIQAAGSARLADMAGGASRRPLATLLFGFAAFSVMGLSPFKGAFSKFLVLYAAIEQDQWALAAAGTLGSIFAAVCYISIIQRVCLERAPHSLRHSRESGSPAGGMDPSFRGDDEGGRTPVALLLPMLVLAAVTVLMSLFPAPFERLAQQWAGMAGKAGLPDYEAPWSALVLLPYLGGFALYGFGRYSAKLRDMCAVVIAVLTMAIAWRSAGPDALSWLFAVIVSGIALVVVVYSLAYMAKDDKANRYYFFLFLMIGSLLGVATERQFGNFYVFWELMTWSSYFLVIHDQTAKALRAGMMYFLMCTVGAYVMHFGILLLHARLGSFDMAVIAEQAGRLTPAAAVAVLALFLGGLGVKAGLVPMHSWLPEAHPVAPSSISAPMSGIVVKAGVFGLAKVLFVLFGAGLLARTAAGAEFPNFGLILSFLGALTLLYGEVMALREADLKRMLAYSTLAQVGEITAVLGVGTYLAVAGSMWHLLNHAMMKSLLFLAAGSLIFRLGARRIDALKGAGKVMPVTGLCFAVGALAVIGLPPFAGFFSKFLMIYACVEADQVPLAAVILAGSFLGAIYYARVIRTLFFEPYEGRPVAEAPASMLLATGVLAALVLAGGLAPGYSLSEIRPVADLAALSGGVPVAAIPDLTMLWPAGALVAVAGAVAAFAVGRARPALAGPIAVATMAAAVLAVIAQAPHYDRLSFWFALLIAGVGGANLLHSIGYLGHGPARHRYYFLFLAMIAGLLGMAGSRDLFNFFAFWELMSSWTLYFLIIHPESGEARHEGFKYFLFNMAGGSLLFLGVAILAVRAGRFDFAGLDLAVRAMPLSWLAWAVLLVLVGMAMKAAMLPVRIDFQMHPATAPTPVSGYISAVLLKSGPYGVLKVMAAMGGAALFGRLGPTGGVASPLYGLAAVAAVTIVYAGAMAVIQTGVKRLLIYSTVCQLGYMLLGLSLGSALGVAGGLMHLVNHMLLKDTLFLAAGCILAQAHIASLDDLGGLARRMPVTFGLFLFAGLSLAGLPPLNGFASKWLIYQAAFQGGHPLLGLAALLGSLFTTAAVLKFAHAAFLGQPSVQTENMTEAPAPMLIAMGGLVAASLAVTVFPGLLLVPIAQVQQALGLEPVAASWTGPLPGPGGWSPAPIAVLLIALAALAWGYTRLSGRKPREVHLHVCGAVDFDLHQAQVNASSLYESPAGLIRGALVEHHKRKEATHA